MQDLTGVTIERYKILRELGRGGMAVVYRAIDTMLDRNVAIKMILLENTSQEKSEKLLKRFNREAKTLAALSHPNIVKVLDYGEYESTPYLVMEFISGGALRSKMGKPIPYAEAATLLLPIARALQHAHQQKIVHRDVKPENILLNDSDQPMLSDFGILKLVDVEESHGLTGTGKIVGTPAYMSPEQIRGREVDGRTDMYSLGILFYELVTGRKPYNANTPIELSLQHLHDPIPKARQVVRDLPAEVDQIIARAIAKNPEDRFPSMAVFAQALEKLSGTTVGTTTAERRALKAAEEKKQLAEKAAREKAEKKQGRSRTPVYGIAAIVVILAVLMAIFRQDIPFLAGPATSTPPAIVATITVVPPKPSPTEPAPQTGTATPGAETPAPTATVISPFTIQTQNASQVVEISRILRISVIKMDWIENGNWLVDAGSNALSFIDTKTAKATKVSLDGGVPLSMSVSNNHIYILLNNSIKVIDAETLKVIKTISPITGGAISMAASPDGKLLALGISNNKTQLLNAEDGTVIRNLKSNYGGWAVAFSPDSQYVVSGTSQGILKWETATGLWQPISGGQDKIVRSLAFSHDGKTIAGAGDGFIFFWNVADGEIVRQVDNEKFGIVSSLDFSPDDSMLVTGTDDNIVRIWDVASGSVIKELTGHTGRVVGACFSPDGRNIASGAGNEASIRIWGLP
ncbi:MAG TPA: protein kinase [Anaerolineales bacterium]|nr:protein kinase [Anaerolineales bacterium]